jgi:metallophosphoesterase (TIGR00282 family)
MRLLFIGDVVGSPGLEMLRRAVPVLRAAEGLDLVIANAENVTNGSGLSPRDYRHVRAAGVDVVTLGDHIYKKFDLAEILASPNEPVGKPANYPAVAPGQEVVRVTTPGGVEVAVVTLMGRTFMRPVDCPFAAVDRVLASLAGRVKVVVVDVHAEATAEKYQLGRYLDGRVSAVVGTHTHVQTADEQLFPGGTAFLCDAGMTGPYDSVLGRRTDRVLHTTITFEPTQFDVATGDVRLAGAVVDVNPETGKATAIRRVMVKEAELSAAQQAF